MYISRHMASLDRFYSCASLSGVGVGAALRATLHHLDGTPPAANVTCFCKSRYFLERVLIVLNSLHFYLQSVHSTCHSNQLFTLRFQRSRSVGCRRSASWHDPSASDDRKGTTKKL